MRKDVSMRTMTLKRLGCIIKDFPFVLSSCFEQSAYDTTRVDFVYPMRSVE